jgi:hypothetical protein
VLKPTRFGPANLIKGKNTLKIEAFGDVGSAGQTTCRPTSPIQAQHQLPLFAQIPGAWTNRKLRSSK